ncbi:MAG: glycerol-3-phosphate acyltransferase [bacterium]
MEYLIPFILGIIFGMIPFSYILGKMKGIDLKKVGSGNIGATNLGRQAGLPFFIFGFILDGLKGLIPVIIAKNLGYITAFAGAGAILGHIFNPLFKFRGGKGVATTIGVGIGIVPRSFLISLAVWIAVYLSTYIVAMASIGFAVTLPIISFIIEDASFTDRIFLMIIAVIIIYAHRSNIKRIIKKEEPKYVLWRKK